jgi:glycosyltransferase involved in cell wall biosynthesis
MEKIFRKLGRWLSGPEISIFHEFHKPPYGGGNQFLLALEKEFTRKGHDVARNKVGKNTKIALFNSFNFDFERLSSLRKRFHPKMIHRVDGPISAYRGGGVEIDQQIWKMNYELADRTIFQSQYSLNKHLELGLTFKTATVIPNAADPEIFNNISRKAFPGTGGKIRLIATAWSDNPKKGGPLLTWLDKHLNHSKYELTFVGRTKAEFKNAKVIEPVPSEKLAQILREHDIYIAASENDPCSNALIEALSCGLPAIYLRSGGHPELVKEGGEGFLNGSELLEAIDKVSNKYEDYQGKINVLSLPQAADEYLKVFAS